MGPRRADGTRTAAVLLACPAVPMTGPRGTPRLPIRGALADGFPPADTRGGKEDGPPCLIVCPGWLRARAEE